MSRKKTIQNKVVVYAADPNSTPLGEVGEAFNGGQTSLSKSILNMLDGGKGSIDRLAFVEDPSNTNEYASVYKNKQRLIPYTILKRIAIQDDLVAAIVNARSNHISAFGRPQPDRFSTGFKIEPKPGVSDEATEEELKALQARIDEATKRLYSCGDEKGWKPNEKMTFSQFLYMQTRNALVVGRFATEIISTTDASSNEKRFHSFRPIDGGTIYRAAPQKEAAQEVRDEALHLLEQLKNDKLIAEKFQNDEYAWIQVLDGRPKQAFTNEECIVHDVYPVTDIELYGYPLTPLDTVIQAVTTHINITRHNRLYFENGRAARGMLVIESEDVDEGVVANIRQNFNASINGVNNAWRMPVIGVAPGEKVTWQPIESGTRDMEFQYLSDTNARVILSAFQMSPEELPGYAHLSRGTNNQALSESNNEYKLEAHRDVGIRPLIAAFQDFINANILPLIDKKLSELCYVRLIGLDAETAEKESVRIQQDMPVHHHFNSVMDAVEKDPLPKELGAEIPFNPQFQAIMDKYVPVGVIMEHLMGIQGAAKNPQYQYVRDPFWFQWQQLQMQMQQMQAQAQQQQQAAQQGQGRPQEGQEQGKGDKPQGGPEKGSDGQEQKQGADGQQQEESELTRSLDQLVDMLSKTENQLPKSKRALLAQQRKLISNVMKNWEVESRKVIDDIVEIAEHHAPTQAK